MPSEPEGYASLGLALTRERRYAEALAALDHALDLRPEYASAHYYRAVALLEVRAFGEALEAANRVLALEPGNAEALIALAQAQGELHQSSESLQSFRRAFPHPDALLGVWKELMYRQRNGLEALAFARDLYRSAPGGHGFAGNYHFASQYMAEWADHDDRVSAIIKGIREGRPDHPLQFVFAADLPQEHRQCVRLTAARRFRAEKPLWRGEIYQHERIRVAYLSADFYQHATAFLMAGLFEKHDRTRFELFALAYGPTPAEDPLRRRIEASFEHFLDVDSIDPHRIATVVRELEIDILVDLKGYTSQSRMEVLSHRPAPVQAHFLGFPGTLGVPFVDYLIADRVVVPPEAEAHYDEQIVRMPDCYQVTDDRRVADVDTWSRERAGLPPQGVVLCAFHHSLKLNPAVFTTWMRLLQRLPTATLWLLARDDAVSARLATEAAARGITPDRIVFAPVVPQAQHLGRLRLADLFLDTWPCASHTTASDALWMGVPLVAVRGRGFAARVSASILEAAGLREFIVDSVADYETLVHALASDPLRLSSLRARIEASVRKSALFDTGGFCRNLERAYSVMRDRTRRGLPPASFDVPRE